MEPDLTAAFGNLEIPQTGSQCAVTFHDRKHFTNWNGKAVYHPFSIEMEGAGFTVCRNIEPDDLRDLRNWIDAVLATVTEAA